MDLQSCRKLNAEGDHLTSSSISISRVRQNRPPPHYIQMFTCSEPIAHRQFMSTVYVILLLRNRGDQELKEGNPDLVTFDKFPTPD